VPREYDDKRYLEWHREFSQLIIEYLDTEGNTEENLKDEFENAVENAKEETDAA
jgi:hypothetical protein